MRDFLKFSDLEHNIKNLDFVNTCENEYKKFIKSVAHRVIDNNIKVVYFCGQSSSGKTTSTTRLKDYLIRLQKKAHLIELDDFYLPMDSYKLNKKGEPDYETIFSLDLKAIYEFKKGIDKGELVSLPNFDFKNASHSLQKQVKIEKDDILIIEGIHSFNRRILKTFGEENSLKVFITVNTEIHFENTKLSAYDLRFIRRLNRDYLYRNASPSLTIKLWKQVRAGEKRYQEGYIKKADIFQNTFLNYEPYLFRNKILPLLEEGIKSSDDNAYFKIIKNKISKFSNDINVTPPGKSILNEFI